MKKSWIVIICLFHITAYSEPKRIYIACDDHTDYIWSGDAETYHQAFIRMLDYYLDLADKTENEPEDFQSRFSCDGHYWLWVYQHEKSREEFERLIERIRSGHITVSLNPLVCCYGGTPMEAAIRGSYYAGVIQRKYNLPFRLALAMENQTLPWGLASIWAGCGVEFSWKGICQCASRVDDAGDREHDIYYWTGPDGQKILMKWNSLLHNNQGMGGYAEARDPWKIVNYAASDPEFKKRYPYSIIGCFGKGWDDLETCNDEFVFAAKSLSDESQRIVVSNEIDFFDDFQKEYGDSLPEVKTSFGNEWELLYASMAEVSASVKRALEKLRAAEAMAAVAALIEPNFWKDDPNRQQAFIDLGLFFEHNWTADGPVARKDREAWQRRIAKSFCDYVDSLHRKATDALAGLIPASDSRMRFFVFNPLGWERSDFVDIPFEADDPLRVVDTTTGKDVPCQRIVRESEKRIRIWANAVPAVGYKVYEILKTKGKSSNFFGKWENSILENDRYWMKVSSNGSIVRLLDKKQKNNEFALASEGPSINQLGNAEGKIQVENDGPVSITLRADVNTPIQRTVRITLYREGERIDIENIITQNFNDVLSYDFGFNLDSPIVRHEEVGAIARAETQSQGGDYADRCARYDWLTFNHFADITGKGDIGVTLSNADSYFFQLGDSEVKRLDTSKAVLRALIGGQIDGENLGIQRQGGDAYFLNRFALRTYGKYDPAAAMRFSLEHQNPLSTGWACGVNPKLPEKKFSAIQVSNPNVLLWAFKPVEPDAGEGIVARLWNLSEEEQSATIQLKPFSIQRAKTVTHLETGREEIPVKRNGISADFKRQQIRTFRLVSR